MQDTEIGLISEAKVKPKADSYTTLRNDKRGTSNSKCQYGGPSLGSGRRRQGAASGRALRAPDWSRTIGEVFSSEPFGFYQEAHPFAVFRFEGLLAEADLAKGCCRIGCQTEALAQFQEHVVGGFVA